MKYSTLARLYSELEATSKTLEKTALLADFLKAAKKAELPILTYLVRGSAAPDYEELELGLGKQLVVKAISQASGASEVKVTEAWREIGDIGEVAEKFVGNKKQATLFSRSLSVREVYDDLRKLPGLSGKGAVDKKLALLNKLLISSSASAAKYIVRTVLGDLRIGVGVGVMRDSIATAFGQEKDAVERAYNATNDFGEVVELASAGELGKASISLGKPIRVMLYPKEQSIEAGFERVGETAIIEYKYDGFRCMIHKDGDKVSLYTRRLDNVTRRFPDIVAAVRKGIKAKLAIIDSEIIGVDKDTGKWVPFQAISQRIKRKYGIERMAKELPVQTVAFDLLYLEGKSLVNTPLRDRCVALKKILKPAKGRLSYVNQITTGSVSEAKRFYEASLAAGNEGVMMKNVESEYIPGSRVGHGVKIKPVMEPLDLVILGGEWGTGRRAGWISSFVLGCRSRATGEFLKIGKVGTGFKEKAEMGVSFEELTARMKKDVISADGRDIIVKPKIVIEVGYEEIQRSPKYGSGYALRFPRLLRLRDDKPLNEVDNLRRVERLYNAQRHR